MERQLDEMMDGGLITLKKAHVILYRSEQSARKNRFSTEAGPGRHAAWKGLTA